MTSSDDLALAVLMALLAVHKRGAAAYASADHELAEPEVAHELERFHQQRLKVIEETEQRIRDLRGDPDDAPELETVQFTVEIGTGEPMSPTEMVLHTLERSEDSCVDALRKALQERELDAATKRLLEQHYELVQTAHDRVRQLRDRAAIHTSPR